MSAVFSRETESIIWRTNVIIFSFHPFYLILVLTIYLIITNEMNCNWTEIQILRIIKNKNEKLGILFWLILVFYVFIYLPIYLCFFKYYFAFISIDHCERCTLPVWSWFCYPVPPLGFLSTRQWWEHQSHWPLSYKTIN